MSIILFIFDILLIVYEFNLKMEFYKSSPVKPGQSSKPSNGSGYNVNVNGNGNTNPIKPGLGEGHQSYQETRKYDEKKPQYLRTEQVFIKEYYRKQI